MTYYEDMELGTILLGSHTFGAEEIKDYAAKYDPQPMHLDEEAANASLFGGLCASGWHTCAVMMRFIVRAYQRMDREAIEAGRPTTEVGPSPGFENLKWLKPVFVGDTITYEMEINRKRVSQSRPGWGLVFHEARARNQHGDLVLTLDGRSFFALREGPDS